ncbi:hypothetical protein B7767_19975 [Streptomyces sp. 13-12-16]|nr:hypothetical protein B7767_19975 [Streptomyces sp. 13-12-16]
MIALTQVVCAVCVALTADWRPHPVTAAAYAALVAGLTGYLGFLCAFAALAGRSAASTWGAIAMGLAFVVALAVGFGVALGSVSAAVALGIRARRARRAIALDLPPDTPTAAAADQ